MDIITLVGPRAVGKSTIGKKLAKQLGYIFFDVDVFMNNKLKKYAGIKGYTDKNGWKKYNNLLKYTLRHEILPSIIRKKVILDCGGGMIGSEFHSSTSMGKLLNKHTKIIMLIPHEDDEKALKMLYERELKRTYWGNTPEDQIKKIVKQHYYERIPLIKKWTHNIIYINNRRPDTIVNFIENDILKYV